MLFTHLPIHSGTLLYGGKQVFRGDIGAKEVLPQVQQLQEEEKEEEEEEEEGEEEEEEESWTH